MIAMLPPLSAGLITMLLLPFKSCRALRWLEERLWCRLMVVVFRSQTRTCSSISILRTKESWLLLRPGGGVQFEAILKGYIYRIVMPEEFSE